MIRSLIDEIHYAASLVVSSLASASSSSSHSSLSSSSSSSASSPTFNPWTLACPNLSRGDEILARLAVALDYHKIFVPADVDVSSAAIVGEADHSYHDHAEARNARWKAAKAEIDLINKEAESIDDPDLELTPTTKRKEKRRIFDERKRLGGVLKAIEEEAANEGKEEGVEEEDDMNP